MQLKYSFKWLSDIFYLGSKHPFLVKVGKKKNKIESFKIEGHFISGLCRDKFSQTPCFMELPFRRSWGCSFFTSLMGTRLLFVSICTCLSSEGCLKQCWSTPILFLTTPPPNFQGNLSFLSLRIMIPCKHNWDPETRCNLIKSLIPQLGLLNLYNRKVAGHCT